MRDIRTPSLAGVIQLAVEATGLAQTPAVLSIEIAKPALLTDNGSGYISNLMAEFLRAHGLKHVRARGHHPQTIGKVERWHRTMKDEVELVVHMSPDELRAAIGELAGYYNRERYHEALKNVIPDDAYFGRREAILARRKALRIRALVARRENCRKLARREQYARAGTPEVYLNSPPELSHNH